MSIRRKKGVGLATLVIAGALAMGSYAFTTSNSLPATHYVGEGVSATAGYTVSAVNWTASSSNLANVTYVNFTLDHPADVVKVQLATTAGAPSGTIYFCDSGVGTGTGAGTGSHDYTVDNPATYGATTTQTADSTHAVCDLSAGGGVANSSISQLTVYAEKQTA